METNGESSFRFMSILIGTKHRSLFARHKMGYKVPHNYVNLRYEIDLQNNAKSLLIRRQAVELFYAGCTSFANRR